MCPIALASPGEPYMGFKYNDEYQSVYYAHGVYQYEVYCLMTPPPDKGLIVLIYM
jgi:hypothetical protein